MGFVLALCGAIPAVFLMWWVSTHDAKRPEPRALLRRAAWFGGLSTIPTIVIEGVLMELGPSEGLAQPLWSAFVVAALTEEAAKAAALYFAVWRNPAFDERFDGIVYATRAGLGFALVENVGYLLGTETLSGFIGVFMLRAFLAVPGHAIYAGFMGYWAARQRFDRTGPGLLGGLAIAVFLHGAYDAALFLAASLAQDSSTAILALPLIVIPFVVVIWGYRRLKAHALEALRLDDLAHGHAQAQGLQLPLGVGFALR